MERKSNRLVSLLLLLCLCINAAHAGKCLSKPTAQPRELSELDTFFQLDFNTSYVCLNSQLQTFVDTYRQWSKHEQKHIAILGATYQIGSLNRYDQEHRHNGSLENFLNSELTYEQKGHFLNVIFKIQREQS
jgi:hypothetical protein